MTQTITLLVGKILIDFLLILLGKWLSPYKFLTILDMKYKHNR